MVFRILGPIELTVNDVRLEVGGARNQKVLAGLILAAGRSVPLSRLVDVVWDDAPPLTSRQQIHKCVAELRGLWQRSIGQDAAGLIVTDGHGYRLNVEAGAIDLWTFEQAVEHAMSLASEGRQADAAAGLRAALELWRGPALAGITSAALDAEVVRLNERRLAVQEELLFLELELGRYGAVISELGVLVAAHPYRERLVELLMLALYRSDRQADALELYHRTRTLLADELGVDPGANLQTLYNAILRQDPAVGVTAQAPVSTAGPAPAVAVPAAQLPMNLASFTGRREHLRALDALLPASEAGDGLPVVISAISGTPGVGKTSLAVHWAHRVRDRFPDGQLYVNLRGYDTTPATEPAQALAQFLRALGVPPEQLPHGEEELASLYRSRLADKRVLILLDNAATAEQVRPLLPGSTGSLVVVTSRDDLRGLVALHDARRLVLDVLTPTEAHALLVQILGEDRVAGEPEAAAELARLCGYLPLALRIAAANLACRPLHSLAEAAEELATGNRLDHLAIDGDHQAAVGAAFDLSYRALPPGAGELLRRLGLLLRTEFTAHAAAALIDGPVSRAKVLVAALENAHLAEQYVPGRFRLHDLIHLYAGDRARAEDSDAERSAARTRLLEHYIHTTDAALQLLAPGMGRMVRPAASTAPPVLAFTKHEAALAWLEAERESLVTSAVQACEHGPRELGWHLVDALRRFLWIRRHVNDLLALGNAGLDAAKQEGNVEAEASMHGTLGTAYFALHNGQKVIEHFSKALGLFTAVNHTAGMFHGLQNLGITYTMVGRLDEAVDALRQALALYSDPASRPHRRAFALSGLGHAVRKQGRLEEAAAYYQQGLEALRQIEDRRGEADLQDELGILYHELGQLERSRHYFTQALNLAREAGTRAYELDLLIYLAQADRDTGQAQRSLDQLEELLVAVQAVNELGAECETLHLISTIYHHLDRLDDAVDVADRALRIARGVSFPLGEITALIDLARVLHTVGRSAEAADHATQAWEIARDRGFRVLEGRALSTLASIDLRAGQHERAQRRAEEALKIQRLTGHRLGEAEALLVLGRVTERVRGADAARPYLDEARKIYTHFTGDGEAPAGALSDADLHAGAAALG
jgi:DNA-binding SARP family transcriptional activator